MSQEKVNRYKKEKANRAQIMKKEKRTKVLEITVFIAVLAALVIWFAVAVVQNVQKNAEANAPTVTTELDLTDFEDYVDSLSAE